MSIFSTLTRIGSSLLDMGNKSGGSSSSGGSRIDPTDMLLRVQNLMGPMNNRAPIASGGLAVADTQGRKDFAGQMSRSNPINIARGWAEALQ